MTRIGIACHQQLWRGGTDTRGSNCGPVGRSLARCGLGIACASLLALTLVACGPRRPDALPADQAIRGTRLATVDLAAEHSVEFWEFTPGIVAIREQMSVPREDGAEPRAEMFAWVKTENATPMELFRSLQPAATPPGALVAAEARWESRQRRQTAAVDDDDVPPSDEARAGERSEDPVDPVEAGQCVTECGCSADYYHDQWGKQWFLNRACTVGAFRFCPVNVGWAYSGRTTSTTFFTYAMAADFDVGTRFKGSHREELCGLFTCWGWVSVLDWDYTVLPRRLEGWYYVGKGRRESWSTGLNPCPRTHFSALRF